MARRVGQVGQGGARGRVVGVERWKARRRMKRWQPRGRRVVVALAANLAVNLGAARGVTAAIVAATAVVVCVVRVAHFL